MTNLIREFINSILTERSSNVRKLNMMSRYITRDIMSLISTEKITRQDYILGPYLWILAIDPTDLDPDEYETILADPYFEVSVSIHPRNWTTEFSIEGYTNSKLDVTAPVSFHIDMMLPVKIPQKLRMQIWREILEVTRHELEHLTQLSQLAFPTRKEPSYYSSYNKIPSNSKIAYFLHPNEIPAFVRGLMHRVRNQKELSQAIHNYLTKYNLSPKQIQQIHDIWMSWFDRNVKSQSFRQ